jgi:hypothetical protein
MTKVTRRFESCPLLHLTGIVSSMNTVMLAADTINLGSGSGLVHDLFAVLIIGICVAIVWGIGRWVIIKFAAPGLVMVVWNGFFILVGAIIVINFLLSLTGHGFITY